MSDYRQRVLKHYPKANCIPWWSGERAWIVVPTRHAFNTHDLGAGPTSRTAWKRAAKKLIGAPATTKGAQ